MILQVFPLQGSFDAFGVTYRLPERLVSVCQKWSLVEIPWGNQIRQGIVIDIIAQPSEEQLSFSLKEIGEVLSPAPWTTAMWGQVSHWVARKNFLPIHAVFSLGIPADIQRYFTKNTPCAFVEKVHENPEEQLFFCKNRSHLFSEIAQDAQRHPTEKIAYIFPDDGSMQSFLRMFPHDNAIISYHRDTPRKKCQGFVRTAAVSGHFFGSRPRLTWPLAGYDTIVVVEDALASHMYISLRPVWYLDLVDAWKKAGKNIRFYSTLPSVDVMARLVRENRVFFPPYAS